MIILCHLVPFPELYPPATPWAWAASSTITRAWSIFDTVRRPSNRPAFKYVLSGLGGFLAMATWLLAGTLRDSEECIFVNGFRTPFSDRHLTCADLIHPNWYSAAAPG